MIVAYHTTKMCFNILIPNFLVSLVHIDVVNLITLKELQGNFGIQRQKFLFSCSSSM